MFDNDLLVGYVLLLLLFSIAAAYTFFNKEKSSIKYLLWIICGFFTGSVAYLTYLSI